MRQGSDGFETCPHTLVQNSSQHCMLLARETHNSMLNLLQVSSNILECSQCTRHVCGEHVLEPLDALARGCFSASQAVFGLHVIRIQLQPGRGYGHSNSPLRHASSCLHELVLALGDSDLEAALLKHIDNILTILTQSVEVTEVIFTQSGEIWRVGLDEAEMLQCYRSEKKLQML